LSGEDAPRAGGAALWIDREAWRQNSMAISRRAAAGAIDLADAAAPRGANQMT
jgi:hypothetical protein